MVGAAFGNLMLGIDLEIMRGKVEENTIMY